MSHTSIYKYKIKDLSVLKKVLEKRNIELKTGDVSENLYSGTIKGTASFKLEKWKYPIIIDNQGNALYDNFQGKWGSMEEFGEVIQAYNQELIMKNLDYTSWDNISISTDKDGNQIIELQIF